MAEPLLRRSPRLVQLAARARRNAYLQTVASSSQREGEPQPPCKRARPSAAPELAITHTVKRELVPPEKNADLIEIKSENESEHEEPVIAAPDIAATDIDADLPGEDEHETVAQAAEPDEVKPEPGYAEEAEKEEEADEEWDTPAPRAPWHGQPPRRTPKPFRHCGACKEHTYVNKHWWKIVKGWCLNCEQTIVMQSAVRHPPGSSAVVRRRWHRR